MTLSLLFLVTDLSRHLGTFLSGHRPHLVVANFIGDVVTFLLLHLFGHVNTDLLGDLLLDWSGHLDTLLLRDLLAVLPRHLATHRARGGSV